MQQKLDKAAPKNAKETAVLLLTELFTVDEFATSSVSGRPGRNQKGKAKPKLDVNRMSKIKSEFFFSA